MESRDSRKAIPECRPGSPALGLLLLLPALLHAVGIAVGFIGGMPFAFGKLDLVIFLGVLLYLSLVVLVIRNREHSLKLILLVYSALVPVLTIEAFEYFTGASEPLPWSPIRTHSMAAATMPGIDGEIALTVNKKGLRGPEHWPANRADRLLCIGGSSTECLFVTDQKTWPWLLGTKLTETFGRPMLVLNAGRSGHTTLHHAYQLAHYRYAPDFGTIIIQCGMNDAGMLFRDSYQKRAQTVAIEALVSPNYDPGVYYRRSWFIQKCQIAFAPRGPDTTTSVKQDLAGNWYADKRLRRQLLLGQNTIDTVPVQLPSSLGQYRTNLIEIIKLCAGRQQRLVFLTQPTLYREGMPRDLENLLWEHTETGAYTPGALATVLAAYNATLQSVCDEYGITCIDLASKLRKDTSVFYDDCHFNLNGCNTIATILCEYIARDLRSPQQDR